MEKRWCAHDTRDFLKDDLVWKDKKNRKRNSCVTIETKPSKYSGHSMLSTQSCERKSQFICEVNNAIWFYMSLCQFLFHQVRLGEDPDKDAAKECNAVFNLTKSTENN